MTSGFELPLASLLFGSSSSPSPPPRHVRHSRIKWAIAIFGGIAAFFISVRSCNSSYSPPLQAVQQSPPKIVESFESPSPQKAAMKEDSLFRAALQIVREDFARAAYIMASVFEPADRQNDQEKQNEQDATRCVIVVCRASSEDTASITSLVLTGMKDLPEMRPEQLAGTILYLLQGSGLSASSLNVGYNAAWLQPNAVYRVSKRTPLAPAPFLSDSASLSSQLDKFQTLPAGGMFRVYDDQIFDGNVWYQVEVSDGLKQWKMWINAIALHQLLEIIEEP